MAREVSSLGDHEHDRSVALAVAAAMWNVRESSLEILDHETAYLQSWSDSDNLDTEALVEGPIQGEGKLSAVNVWSGETLLWGAADSGTTEVTTAPGKLFCHEVSSWLRDDDSCVAFMLSPTHEDGEDDGDDAGDSGGGMQLKGDCDATKDCFSSSRVSLKKGPQTSLKAPVSATLASTPVAFSPTSLAEDVVSFLEAESPSPTFAPVDEREDYLMHEDKGSGDEADMSRGEDRFGEVLEDVMAVVPAGDEKCSDERTRRVLGDDAVDNQYQDVDQYVDTQHAFLREKELELTLRSNYVDGPNRPGAVTAASRAAILDGLRRLHALVPTAYRNSPKLSQETLFLAANILDRFLSKPEARGRLLEGGYQPELAAVSALGLAAKFEDVEVPSLWHFAAASKLASGRSGGDDCLASCSQTSGEGRPAGSRCECDVCEARVQLVRVEGLITSALGFRMMAPTVMSFLGIYLVRARHLGRRWSPYVMENLRSEAIETLWSVVRDASSFSYRPSELAAAALYLASSRASSSTPLWFDLLAITGIELKQLQGCLRNMQRVKASAPTLAEEVTHRDPISFGSLEHADDDIRLLGDEGNANASGGPGTLGAEGGCELRGGASRVGGMEEAPGVEAGHGLVDSVPSLGGLGTGSGFGGGDTVMSGGIKALEEREGDGFVDSVLRLGGLEADGGFGPGAPGDGGVVVSEVEVGGGFADSVLRLGGVETNSEPGGGDCRGGILEVSVAEVYGAFAESVLRLGGVETNSEPGGGDCRGGILEVSVAEVYGAFAESVLRLGGVETNSEPGGGDCRGGILEVSVVDVYGAFAESVLRLGGVEAANGFGGRGLEACGLQSEGPAEALNDFGIGGTEGVVGGSSDPLGTGGRGASRSGVQGDVAEYSISIEIPVNSSGSIAGAQGSISLGGGDSASTWDHLTSLYRSGGKGKYGGSILGSSGRKLGNRDCPSRCGKRDRNGAGVMCHARSRNYPVGDCGRLIVAGVDSTTAVINDKGDSCCSGDASSGDPMPGGPRGGGRDFGRSFASRHHKSHLFVCPRVC